MPKPRINLDSAKPLTLQQARQRHANIANAYFKSTPTVSNLYNGSINWLRSKGILTPQGTGVVTGDVPLPYVKNDLMKALKHRATINRLLNETKYNIDDPNFPWNLYREKLRANRRVSYIMRQLGARGELNNLQEP